MGPEWNQSGTRVGPECYLSWTKSGTGVGIRMGLELRPEWCQSGTRVRLELEIEWDSSETRGAEIGLSETRVGRAGLE